MEKRISLLLGERASLLPPVSKPRSPWPANQTPKRWFAMAIILMVATGVCIHHLYFQDAEFRNLTPATHFYLFLMFGPPGVVFGLLGLALRGLNLCKRSDDLEHAIMQLLALSVVWCFLANLNYLIPYCLYRYQNVPIVESVVEMTTFYPQAKV